MSSIKKHTKALVTEYLGVFHWYDLSRISPVTPFRPPPNSPDFRDIIEAHANTYRLAQEIFF